MVSETTSEYADVTDMFRQLKTLDAGSVAYRRQREAIVARTLPLADHIARRYRNRGEPIEDLIQAARVGLVNAVNRFDPDNGANFLSFAVPTMMGEVRRHFRDYGWAVKVPRRLKDLQGQLVKARAELSQQIGRAPTASEVAAHLGIDRESVMEATIASSNYSTLSTDVQTSSDHEHRSVGDTFGDVDPNIDKVVDLETVRPLIAALPEREQTVLTLRFFESMTQTQIAERMGYSQMHVSRLLAQALRRLREQVAEPPADEPPRGRRRPPPVRRGAA
ncbi:RNA polymerase sigma-B factor [Mycolicibacterium rutilum]|uniref:RNA polymerase sigma-B factor n=1 Tax=Mycolicibacterium rutilum TaxID=370526 RepID=A0A1H6LK41_MYCRU|nr:RNA polymerase sigma-B factor [Mycolicibacterium rutilum]